MDRIIKEAQLSMRLKEVELNIKLLNLVCERDDVAEILLDDIEYNIDALLSKIDNYKRACKRG